MVDFKKEPVAPQPAPKPEPDYVYSGEKNYEAPKPDPWIEEKK